MASFDHSWGARDAHENGILNIYNLYDSRDEQN